MSDFEFNNDKLRFVNAGEWSENGTKFALVTYDGSPAFTLDSDQITNLDEYLASTGNKAPVFAEGLDFESLIPEGDDEEVEATVTDE